MNFSILVCTIRRSELQLLGAATLFLSAKLRESFSPLTEVEVIVAYTDRSITAQQLLVSVLHRRSTYPDNINQWLK